jgi:hypothetical protein
MKVHTHVFLMYDLIFFKKCHPRVKVILSLSIEIKWKSIFCPICHSVMSVISPKLYPWLQLLNGLSIRSLIRPFPWVPKNLTLWHWLWCLTYLLKTLTLAVSFEWYVLGPWYFTRVFLMTIYLDLFMGTKIFHLLNLILVFDLLIEYFNFGYIFWMEGTRALTFHMNIPCNKTFSWVQKFVLVTLTMVLDLFIENFNLGYIFWLVGTRLFDISHEYSL